MTTEQKQRKPRADRGPRLIERDFSALEWITQQYAISIDHLAVLLARLIEPGEYKQTPKEKGQLTEKRTMAVVRRWEMLGLIEKKWIIHGEPAWIWLTPEGLRLVSESLGELRAYTPTPGKLNHLYYINFARLYIESKRHDAEWTSEREIRSHQKIEPGKRPHTPDGLVTTKEGREIAVEIELTTKTYGRLNKILYELAFHRDYHTIWYFCGGRANTIVKNAIDNLHQAVRSKFVIYDIDEIDL